MPSCAIDSVSVDYIVPVENMPALLLPSVRKGNTVAATEIKMEKHLTDLTCPECRSPLSELKAGNLVEYRCRVGHAYSSLAFAQYHQNTVERKLWKRYLYSKSQPILQTDSHCSLAEPTSNSLKTAGSKPP
jgi:two-component system, chemotaxis family, protein-glutamate methylesterase/glutaminase